MNRICHFFHFRTLAGPLSSTFEMMTSHGFWEMGHFSDETYLIQGSKETTACNFEKNRAQGLFWKIGNIVTISG